MDSLAFLMAVATRVPGISLANALGMMEDAQRFLIPQLTVDPTNLRSMVEAASRNPAVMENLPDRKIQAIKELRNATKSGLLEAKNAIDFITANSLTNALPAAHLSANGR